MATYCPLCRANKPHDTCQEIQEGGPGRIACHNPERCSHG